jgi:hypothetical protein
MRNLELQIAKQGRMLGGVNEGNLGSCCADVYRRSRRQGNGAAE